MGLFKKLKTKIIEPQIHETEDNLSLTTGAHILFGCKNVTLSGNAVVLETTDSNFLSLTNKAKIKVMHNGEIDFIADNMNRYTDRIQISLDGGTFETFQKIVPNHTNK